MEVTGLGMAYLDDFQKGFNSSSVSSSALAGQGAPDFAQIMAKAGAERDKTGISNPANENIDKTDKLYGLCLELETFLVKNLLTGMRNTVQKSGLIDEGFAGKIYEDMLYDEYAKDLTKNAGFGLAEQAYRQLKQYM
ncbi:MAG: rod-binding protein [Treponema sp.]|jgi:flagellar protein FlgJ|nr:rod-binding protein [Treponema sp.]